jgi:hypothetical protein
MRLCPAHGHCCQRSELRTAFMCCMYFYIQNEYFGRASQHSHIFCIFFLFYLCNSVNVLVLVSELALCCQACTLVNWVGSWLCRSSICVIFLHIPVIKHDWLSQFKITSGQVKVNVSKIDHRETGSDYNAYRQFYSTVYWETRPH